MLARGRGARASRCWPGLAADDALHRSLLIIVTCHDVEARGHAMQGHCRRSQRVMVVAAGCSRPGQFGRPDAAEGHPCDSFLALRAATACLPCAISVVHKFGKLAWR